MVSPPDDFDDPLADIDPVMEQAFSVSEGDEQEPSDDSEEFVVPSLDDDLDLEVSPEVVSVDSSDNVDEVYEDAVSEFDLDESDEDVVEESDEFEVAVEEAPLVVSGASPEMDVTEVVDEIEEEDEADVSYEPTVYEEENELDALFQGGTGSVDENLMGFGQEVPEISVEDPVVDRFEDVSPDVPDISQIEFPDLSMHSAIGPKIQEDVFSAIPVSVSVELGRANLSLKEVYELSEGSIIELERLVGEPLDLVVNGQVIAQGEVVAIDNKYGLRIKTIVSAASAAA